MAPTRKIRPFQTLQVALTAVIASLALTSCGSSVDVPGLEKDMKSGLPALVRENGIGSDMAVSSVSCPREPSGSDGSKFRCDFTVEDGSKGVATAEVSGEDVTYRVSRYAAGQISQAIATFYAEDQDIEVTADCADPVKDGMVCDFEDGDGATGTITVTTYGDGFKYSPEYD